MPIKVVCQCGASFAAKDEMAGKTVACPKCKQPLSIGGPGTAAPATNAAAAGKPAAQPGPRSAAVRPAPAAGGLDDLFDEVGLTASAAPRCSQCNAPLKPGAVLCVACGWHLQTGAKLEGAAVQAAGHDGHGAVAEDMLKRAASQIDYDTAEVRKVTNVGAPAWVYFLWLLAIIAFAIMMFTLPRDMAFLATGWSTIGVGCLIIFAYGIVSLVVAYFESTKQGLLCTFVPFYNLYYLATRWSRIGKYFMMQLMGAVVCGVGGLFILISPYMKVEEQGPGSWIRSSPALVAGMPTADSAPRAPLNRS